MMKKSHKTFLVMCAAVVLSTVGIRASDVVRNVDGELITALSEEESVCPLGMIQIHIAKGSICIDMFEASPAAGCPVSVVSTAKETQFNLNEVACMAQSVSEAVPWRFVSFQQAQRLCARAGKRLPDNDEWFAAASAIGDETTCITKAEGPGKTGVSQCLTAAGVHDLVGNVWEWVDAEIQNGLYNGRRVPYSGYVHTTDTDGVALITSAVGLEEYGYDYVKTDHKGIFGMVRGGFYGSADDAGLYAQNLAVPFDTKAPGVGFRCVADL